MANNLTLPSSPTFATGKFGQAFNSTGTVGGTVALNSGSTFTFEAWFNSTSQAAGTQVIAGFDGGAWFGFGAGYITGAGMGQGPAFNDGVWRHAAYTYDGTNAKLYVNGTLVLTNTSSPLFTGSTFRVGNYTYGSSVNVFAFQGLIDEAALFSGVRYTGNFTPPSAAYTGSEPNLLALYHFDGNGNDSSGGGGGGALTIGSLMASASSTGIAVSLSASLSGGAGSGYSYRVYRGTDPNFTPASGTLLASPTSMPYTDTTAALGTQYYFGVVGTDGTTSVNAVPTGLSPLASSPSTLLYESAALPNLPAFAMVCIGDSITYGAGLTNGGSSTVDTVPAIIGQHLRRMCGERAVTVSNQGVSGTTSYDWGPAGTPYANAKGAMTGLLAASPTATPVFSIMLGTNDSSASLGAYSPATYKTQMKAIVDQLRADFPAAQIVLHRPIWYSPNTHNSAVYEQAGLSLLVSYTAQLAALATSYTSGAYLGDQVGFDIFAQSYLTSLQGDTSGPNGTFFLHPTLTGAAVLGELQANAIYAALQPHRFTVLAA